MKKRVEKNLTDTNIGHILNRCLGYVGISLFLEFFKFCNSIL